jgi:hypothetical protein
MVVLAGAVLALAGCAAGDARFTDDAPAGFWVGLWHGVISVVTLVIGIFTDTVEVYETSNTGGWYDFGFLLGVICIWGGGGSCTARRKSRKREERNEQEWEEIGKRVEKKLERKIRQWAEAEPNEDWDVVEEKAEEKLKKKIREWAEDDEKESSQS